MIPDWLRDKLASPPAAGAGIHGWLFSCARQLHAHMPASAIEAALSAATAGAGRRVTEREIRDAVKNSHAVQWTSKPKGNGTKPTKKALASEEETVAAQERWPEVDKAVRRARVADMAAEGMCGLAELFEWSPIRPEGNSVDDWLDALFPAAEWLCLASGHPGTARSRRREKWSFGPAEVCDLIVPSPMTGPSGKNLNGDVSHRCLDNTGSRRWLVVEFDKLQDGKTNMPINVQAALHWHFREACVAAGWPPLRLVVFSGSKSLHGWYGPCRDEANSRELMEYARIHGADTATWNRCQLVRLPGGLRERKVLTEFNLPDGWEPEGPQVRQEIFFCDL